eukprot:TRINITY_DN14762_c2_g1_i2.p1 TRINITY_DN14762_c2_g1~~TRINITY_DN14762_c2_g1_i2.p1  ORF type:complete len:112 (+),score=12.77 TRINITY_DN14762_c2_g1_i2:89-424(+)
MKFGVIPRFSHTPFSYFSFSVMSIGDLIWLKKRGENRVQKSFFEDQQRRARLVHRKKRSEDLVDSIHKASYRPSHDFLQKEVLVTWGSMATMGINPWISTCMADERVSQSY